MQLRSSATFNFFSLSGLTHAPKHCYFQVSQLIQLFLAHQPEGRDCTGRAQRYVCGVTGRLRGLFSAVPSLSISHLTPSPILSLSPSSLSLSHKPSRPASQPPSQPTSQPTSQPATQPASQPANHPPTQPASQRSSFKHIEKLDKQGNSIRKNTMSHFVVALNSLGLF